MTRNSLKKSGSRLAALLVLVHVAAITDSNPAVAESGPDGRLEKAPPMLETTAENPSSWRRPTWSINIDNDVFAPGNEDRDYTGGIAVAVSGVPIDDLPAPIRRLRLFVANTFGAAASQETRDGVIVGGLAAFTPDDIGSAARVPDDRPYASLAYVGASVARLDLARQAVSRSTLIVGLLGTSMAERLQTSIHRQTGAPQPAGYSHQISDGGELTARFSFARHTLIREGSTGPGSFDARVFFTGSVGYLTELTGGLAIRWGRIASPWWSSGFEYAGYDLQLSSAGSGAGSANREFYVTAGVQIRARIYNALLHGQFRESPAALDFDATNPVLADAWLGVTRRTARLTISYLLRVQTAEVRHGLAARNISWASVSIARSIR